MSARTAKNNGNSPAVPGWENGPKKNVHFAWSSWLAAASGVSQEKRCAVFGPRRAHLRGQIPIHCCVAHLGPPAGGVVVGVVGRAEGVEGAVGLVEEFPGAAGGAAGGGGASVNSFSTLGRWLSGTSWSVPSCEA